MTKLFGLFSGVSPWVYLIVGVAMLAAGGAAGYAARGVIDAPALSHQETLTSQADTRTAQCLATHEKGRADGDEQVIAALGQSAADVAAATAELARNEAARKTATANFLKDLANAPKSSVCGGSAAELAYRNSVRAQHAAAAP